MGVDTTDDPSQDRLGSFLVHSQMQTSVHSSALFLTAAAQNLLCMKLASELGVLIVSPWVTWFKAAIVPALVGILVTPFLMFKVRQPPCFVKLRSRELVLGAWRSLKSSLCQSMRRPMRRPQTLNHRIFSACILVSKTRPSVEYWGTVWLCKGLEQGSIFCKGGLLP